MEPWLATSRGGVAVTSVGKRMLISVWSTYTGRIPRCDTEPHLRAERRRASGALPEALSKLESVPDQLTVKLSPSAGHSDLADSEELVRGCDLRSELSSAPPDPLMPHQSL